MSMKSILAPVDGAKSSHMVLEAAFLLAQEFNAHVNVLHVKPDPKAAIPLLGEGMSGAMIEDMIEIAEKEGNEQRKKAQVFYKAALESHNVKEATMPLDGDLLTARWTEDEGREDEVIARNGRLSDLILVPKPVKENEIYSTLALNAALFETGRPMLLLPEQGMETFPKSVAICWNGSMEGARAVSAALPFLKHADEVYVMTADTNDTDETVGNELCEYLMWHAITAKTVFFSPAVKSVGEALLAETKKLGSQMMVMGGYSHSRMHELILGGVTRDVISSADIPVVMGH